jgi:hypothetical protein
LLGSKSQEKLGSNELCCIKAKKRVQSFERHSVPIGDVFQKSKEQNVKLKMSKSRNSRFGGLVREKAK